MKRLVVTGIGCSPRNWENWLGPHDDTVVLSLFDILKSTESNDLRDLARFVENHLEEGRPQSIICHDLGVPLVLMSLMRLERRGLPVSARVTLFNGTFRPLKLKQSSNPLRAQWMPFDKAVREIEAYGGHLDERLKPFQTRVRALYRKLVWISLHQSVKRILGLEELTRISGKPLTRSKIQIIASPNDPYIPIEMVHQLRADVSAERLVEVPYGHFPYTIPSEKLLPYVREFEANAAS